MRLAEQRRAIAVAVGLLLLVALARAQTEERGAVLSPGSLTLRCEAAACQVSWPLLEGVDVAAGLLRVFAGHPGGRYPLRVQTELAELGGWFAVCGGATVVDIYPERIEVRGNSCPPSGVVRLRGVPTDAQVSIEHVPVDLDEGGEVHVRQGVVVVSVQHAGSLPFEQAVFVADGAIVEMTPELAARPGTLVLEFATAGTSVTLDEQPVLVDGAPNLAVAPDLGVAPDGLRLSWPAGDVVVVVERPHHEPKVLVVTVGPGATASRVVVLEPYPALLTLVPFPLDAHVELNGAPVATGQELALPPGAYEVSATAPGFDPFASTLELVPGARRVVELELAAPAVGLQFVGAPAGATVRVDGSEPTPVDAAAELAVPPGHRTLLLEASGYVPLVLERTVTPGPSQRVEVRMERYATLRLVGLVSGAVVRIDGQRRRVTPSEPIELREGRYTVEVEAAGYEPFEATIFLGEGESQEVVVTFVALPGRIHLPPLPAGMVVRLDGVVQAVRDGVVTPVAPGVYELELSSRAYETLTRRVSVNPGRSTYVRAIELVPQPATLVLDGAPLGTRVKVGNADVVEYRGPLRIPHGEHVVWIAAEGHGRVRVDIEVGPGERVVVPVSFD